VQWCFACLQNKWNCRDVYGLFYWPTPWRFDRYVINPLLFSCLNGLWKFETLSAEMYLRQTSQATQLCKLLNTQI
jgi:hypothetical protein